MSTSLSNRPSYLRSFELASILEGSTGYFVCYLSAFCVYYWQLFWMTMNRVVSRVLRLGTFLGYILSVVNCLPSVALTLNYFECSGILSSRLTISALALLLGIQHLFQNTTESQISFQLFLFQQFNVLRHPRQSKEHS